MSLQRNFYEVLGLPHRATTDEIKRKYRELARKFHPDVVQDKALGQKVFSQINQAYRVLVDPERRAQYDSTLEAEMLSRNAAARAAGHPQATAAPRAGGAPITGTGTMSAGAITKRLADAEQAIMQGKFTEARAMCESIVKSDPRNAKAWSIIGDALVQIGKSQEAANAYRNSLQISPSPLLQAKLNRITGVTPAPPPSRPAPTSGTIPPARPAPGAAITNGNGTHNHTPPAAAPQAKPVGLFGRFIGKK